MTGPECMRLWRLDGVKPCYAVGACALQVLADVTSGVVGLVIATVAILIFGEVSLLGVGGDKGGACLPTCLLSAWQHVFWQDMPCANTYNVSFRLGVWAADCRSSPRLCAQGTG